MNWKCLFALLLFVPSLALAREGTGVGVILGSPNGLSVRQWLAPERSIDGAAGWALGKDSRFQVHASYLWSRNDAIRIGDYDFDAFFGAGAVVRTKSGKNENEVVFGPRIPGGVSFYFENPVIEVFAQLALNVGLIPNSDVFLDGGIGARLYF